jgi:hypothetical protein
MNSKIRLIQAIFTVLGILPLLNLGAIAFPVFAQQAEAVEEAITEQVYEQEQSSTEVIEYTIPVSNRQEFNSREAFDSLMHEANTLAQSLVGQGFVSNPTATEVIVNVLGERNGQVIPLVSVRVSRVDWQSEQRIEQWARYAGRPARQLLGFVDGVTHSTITSSPPSTTAATPTRSSNSSSLPANFVPLSSGTVEDYVLPGMSLEEGDPGYR